MRLLTAFISGGLFSIGLIISGMINPNKVIGFLDIFGQWDPDLAFVMGGAVVVNLITFPFLMKRKAPVCGGEMSLPQNTKVDAPLVVGSIIFGIGWGLVGICPGPGLVNMVTLRPKMLLFMVFLILGVLVKRWISKRYSI